jgi:hypothetical protein
MQNINHKIGFEDKRLSFADNWRKSQKIVIITLAPAPPPGTIFSMQDILVMPTLEFVEYFYRTFLAPNLHIDVH